MARRGISRAPCKNSAVEFSRRNLIRAAVCCARNVPNDNSGLIPRMNQIGVVGRNIFVAETMNEKHRNIRPSHSLFRRCSLHIQAVLESNEKKANFDCRPEERPSQPRAGMKWTPESRIGNFAKGREW